MIDVRKLKALIIEKGETQKSVSKSLNITPHAFRARLRKGVLTSDQIMVLIDVLEISNPEDIFFVKEITY